MKQTTDFAKYLSDFFGSYLPNERGLSPNTIKTYSQTFTLLLRFMLNSEKIKPDYIKLADLTKDRILNFLGWLESERNVSVSTRNARLVALQSFFRFLQYRDVKGLSHWHGILSIEQKKTTPPQMSYLSEKAVNLILNQPDLTTRHGYRDYTLLALLYDSGARVQELINLTASSVRFGEITSVKLFGKGSKIRNVPLSPPQAANLKKYILQNGMDDTSRKNSPLFPNPRGNNLSRMAILNIVKKYVEMARKIDPRLIPPKVGCHTFRHSKAMHMLDANINLVDIRDFLGHVSVTTTEIYARASEKRKMEALKKMNPTLIINENSSWQKDGDLLDYLKGLQYNH